MTMQMRFRKEVTRVKYRSLQRKCLLIAIKWEISMVLRIRETTVNQRTETKKRDPHQPARETPFRAEKVSSLSNKLGDFHGSCRNKREYTEPNNRNQERDSHQSIVLAQIVKQNRLMLQQNLWISHPAKHHLLWGEKDVEGGLFESTPEEGYSESSEEGSPIVKGCREGDNFSPETATAERSNFMLHPTKGSATTMLKNSENLVPPHLL
ncbi:hypothetical protein OIU84_012444 [Salix udensis]|uniref:Uncharacterized protein n=1 Tax=Salix udensis TaxID=889485 RepID=A0AAD6NT91_9ROSI|nr:hypothetical protein OIU84_012444 [Salix udensis]